MTPHTDNVMARFLFAILKQKDLKDIDWNKVAEDPVLKEPIPNGHAARMRFARFRATVTGAGPERRSLGEEKARVAKPKKVPQSRKKVTLESEARSSLSTHAQYSPTLIHSPFRCDAVEDITTRFLTPCSDDMSHVVSVPPAVMERDICPGHNTSTCINTSSDYMDHAAPSPAFTVFDGNYDLAGYEVGHTTTGSLELERLNNARPSEGCDQAWNNGGYQDVLPF